MSNPSAETLALVECIRTGELSQTTSLRSKALDGGGFVAAITPAPTATASSPKTDLRQTTLRHNLPPQATRFIGRDVELAALDELIADPNTRLVTIVGPGGIGKTRLALAVAERQLTPSSSPYEGEVLSSSPLLGGIEGGRFANGVYFVSLAPLSEPVAIVPTIAEAVGYSFQSDSRPSQRQLLDYLRQKKMLLILDNIEHLLSESNSSSAEGNQGQANAAKLIIDILHTAPHLTILVTSRQRLRLQQEAGLPATRTGDPIG